MAWTVAARQAGASAASSSPSTVSCSRRPPIRWHVAAPYIWLAQPQAVAAQADDHLPGRAELAETAEHARDRLACRLIRRDDHVVIVVVVQPGGQHQAQLAAGGLGAQALGQP